MNLGDTPALAITDAVLETLMPVVLTLMMLAALIWVMRELRP